MESLFPALLVAPEKPAKKKSRPVALGPAGKKKPRFLFPGSGA
jgi:hypothetical protein